MKINNRKFVKSMDSMYIKVLNSWKGSGLSVMSLKYDFSFLPEDKSPPTSGRGKYTTNIKILYKSNTEFTVEFI